MQKRFFLGALKLRRKSTGEKDMRETKLLATTRAKGGEKTFLQSLSLCNVTEQGSKNKQTNMVRGSEVKLTGKEGHRNSV